jgi:hypothetical protein
MNSVQASCVAGLGFMANDAAPQSRARTRSADAVATAEAANGESRASCREDFGSYQRFPDADAHASIQEFPKRRKKVGGKCESSLPS